MKLHMSRQYQYVKIDDYYFCLQQSPAVLAWILFFKRADLTTIQPWLKKDYPRWKLQYFRHHWRMFKRNCFNLMFFTLCQLGLRNLETVQLPVYGQFGMAVHKGFKIFNLRTRVVTKIYDTDIDKSSILSEIEQLKKVSKIDFAPSLRKWDIDERWYQEDYIRSSIAAAHRSSDSSTVLEVFYRESVPCMHRIIFFQHPMTKDLSVYLKELITILEAGRLLRNESKFMEAEILRDFMNSTIEQLNAEGNRPVHLVFSHGDFCPANFLNTKNGIKIVDWETSGYRNLLFDFYSYFFYRVTSGKLPVDQIASEINEALPNFVSGLYFKMPGLSEGLLSIAHIYRRIFYIEYLCKLVERDLTDNRLNITGYIVRYIEAFSHYENILSTEKREIRYVH